MEEATFRKAIILEIGLSGLNNFSRPDFNLILFIFFLMILDLDEVNCNYIDKFI